MSVHVSRELVVQDAGDEFTLRAQPYDDNSDWSDDEGPALARLQVNNRGPIVFMHRDDLRNLRTFINEILRKDGLL